MYSLNKSNQFRIDIFCLLFSILLLFPQYCKGQSADSTRQIIIEKIEIVGNSKTEPDVIFRYITFKSGDFFNPAVLVANYRRLSQTNFFKKVDIYPRPGSEKGQVVVVVEVKERNWPNFRFEGGNSDLDGWYIVPISLRFDNFFGKGNFIGGQFKIGTRIAKFLLNYQNPNMFNSSGFLDIELFWASQEFIHYVGSSQTHLPVEYPGIRFRIGGTRAWYKYIFFAYRNINYNNFLSGPPDPSFADDFQDTRVSAFTLGVHSDQRDNPAYPLRGFWGALTAERADKFYGSDVNISKFTFDARIYKRISRKNVFAFHFKAGYTTEEAPFYERFFLGGGNSLRGYDDARLTPIGWGTKLLLTQSEFRFPLSNKKFPHHKHTGVIFFDAGGIWLPGQTPDIDDFFSAVGFGYRIKLPIVGLTRFDLAFPLNISKWITTLFHLEFGHTF